METTFLDKKNYTKLYTQQAGEDRKKFWRPILKLIAVTAVASIILNLLGVMVFGDSIVSQIILQLINFFITLYSIKFLLNLIDTGNTSLKETFSGLTGKQFLYALGAYILYTLVVYAGFILLIVPGIIWSYMFMLSFLISADSVTKPLAAMKESRRLTKGYKMKMFITMLSVVVHYMAVPIIAFLLILLAQFLLLPIWITGVLIAVAVVFSIYAQFALFTILPRIYRDLQNIQGNDNTVMEEIIEVEEVLEGDQTNETQE